MLQPPLHGLGAGFWFRAKILEISALILVEPTEELFCQRHKRLALERVERVKDALARDLENPPSLSELGREVGCSPFYLSRIFSEHTGLTISATSATCALSAPQSCFEADAPMSLRRPWQLATLV
jgi:AraC-like DNA-binding protein